MFGVRVGGINGIKVVTTSRGFKFQSGTLASLTDTQVANA